MFRTSRTNYPGADQQPHTLGQAFENRPNSLNAVRLSLAATVVFSHSWHLGGYGEEPQMFRLGLGTWAVLAFFGISGYLITRSRVSQESSWRFLRARILRILPGLWFSVALVAYAIAPTAAALSGRIYSPADAFSFIVHNGLFLSQPPGVSTIGETLSGLLDERFWNAPLWTLFWEAFCYVVVGLLGALLRPRLFAIAAALLFVVGTAGILLASRTEETSYWVSNGPIAPLTAFFAGSVIYLQEKRVHFSVKSVLGWLSLTGIVAATGLGNYLIFLPFIVCTLLFSLLVPLAHVGQRHDISYGVYIYGWPVQQCLAMAGIQKLFPPTIFAAVSLLAVLPFAWFSCVVVERPAQKLAKFMERKPGYPQMIRGTITVGKIGHILNRKSFTLTHEQPPGRLRKSNTPKRASFKVGSETRARWNKRAVSTSKLRVEVSAPGNGLKRFINSS